METMPYFIIVHSYYDVNNIRTTRESPAYISEVKAVTVNKHGIWNMTIGPLDVCFSFFLFYLYLFINGEL